MEAMDSCNVVYPQTYVLFRLLGILIGFRTDPATTDLINFDLNELKIATTKLINHSAMLVGVAFGISFLKWVASFIAM